MSAFAPRLDILPPAQRLLWPSLRGSTALDLVLYGGTAIGLRLGHRQSVDFDFMSEKPLDRAALSQALPFLAAGQVLQDEPNSFTVMLSAQHDPSQMVKLSFFGDINFGRVGTPQLTNDGIVEVASLEDLMATKVKVILQRIEAKDYKDIAAMLSAGVSLEDGLGAARRMYFPAFQPSESLKALTYFEGGDLNELSEFDRQTLTQAVQKVRRLTSVGILSRQLSSAGNL